MDRPQKQLARAAAKIRQALVRCRRGTDRCLPTDTWEELLKLAGRARLARQRGWDRALASVLESLAWTADSCRIELTALSDQWRKDSTRKPLAGEAEIFRDLLALRQEFDEVDCDLSEHEVWVTTDPIVLEGLALGRFEIRLNWQRLSDPLSYRVVALDPNRAAKDEQVTHPHVRDEGLCAGDGATAIRAALGDGRIGDFFLIVARVLSTYSRGSAFVELDDWDEVSCCSNCDASCSDDERYSCDDCGASLCSECTIACPACGYDHCSQCISSCPQCNEEFCTSCLKTCQQCQVSVCPNCLQEDGLCQACFDKQQPAEDQDGVAIQTSDQQAPALAGAAFQSHGVGQTAVSPRPRDERGRWVRRHAA